MRGSRRNRRQGADRIGNATATASISVRSQELVLDLFISLGPLVAGFLHDPLEPGSRCLGSASQSRHDGCAGISRNACEAATFRVPSPITPSRTAADGSTPAASATRPCVVADPGGGRAAKESPAIDGQRRRGAWNFLGLLRITLRFIVKSMAPTTHAVGESPLTKVRLCGFREHTRHQVIGKMTTQLALAVGTIRCDDFDRY